MLVVTSRLIYTAVRPGRPPGRAGERVGDGLDASRWSLGWVMGEAPVETSTAGGR